MNANPDPQQIQTIVSFLAPFLPYLIAGATKAAEAVGKTVGELGSKAAWKKAQGLWGKLKGKLGPKQKAKAGVIAVDPKDEEEVTSFARTLLQTLQEAPDLAAELSALLGDADDETVQQVIARNQSLVAKVVQKGPGHKTVLAEDGSTIVAVRQE